MRIASESKAVQCHREGCLLLQPGSFATWLETNNEKKKQNKHFFCTYNGFPLFRFKVSQSINLYYVLQTHLKWYLYFKIEIKSKGNELVTDNLMPYGSRFLCVVHSNHTFIASLLFIPFYSEWNGNITAPSVNGIEIERVRRLGSLLCQRNF